MSTSIHWFYLNQSSTEVITHSIQNRGVASLGQLGGYVTVKIENNMENEVCPTIMITEKIILANKKGHLEEICK
jgi:hypothetical protein